MSRQSTKQKRKKPFPANLASRKALEAEGWSVAVVEQRIPHTFITRDVFGFADLLACSPTKGIMLVQVTGGKSTSNFHKRVAKIKSNPLHALWLASGGRIQVHSWEKKKPELLFLYPSFNGRACRVLEVNKVNPDYVDAKP